MIEQNMLLCHHPMLLQSAIRPLISQPIPYSTFLPSSIGSSVIVAVTKIRGEYKYRGPRPRRELLEEWISNNDEVIRTSPIYVGCFSLAAVLLNRTLSGVSPVADASSSQSRADVLTLALAVTILLTGLVWISIRPKYSDPVKLQGVECNRVDPALPTKATAELFWVWDSLSGITCCQALVIVHNGTCLLQLGIASESAEIQGVPMFVDAHKLVQGSLCQGIQNSGKQNYLANLALYPGRFELPFLPQNTQAVILQPLGDDGVMIVAGDRIRGFSPNDQAWIAMISEKLDTTLSKFAYENYGPPENTNCK
eukprot:Gb_38027 [translate_table: standard]